MNVNYSKVFAIKKKNKEIIQTLCPGATNTSGIYVFFRTDENGFKFAYVGQAIKSLLERMAEHLEGYEQWIDKSIKSHKLYDKDKNPYGYKASVLCYCKPEECNDKETYFIKKMADAGYQLRNITGGSQGQGKFNINNNKSSKGYYDGLKQGRKNAIKELKHIIDRYFIITLKKDGKLGKNALEKFENILNEVEEKENGNIRAKK